ncbi:3-hydroxyacyl-CoA dehydrogenase NAD-binding domain-containing protein [Streptomyces europaeiscabiei]|uniref:3-hydroxyacyl-CoA dehydrogenase NAD-binding domain-containing protein n=1 Tax=Streptomyces europaeiscabiei TaxID=146819 RepID=UPI0038D46998
MPADDASSIPIARLTPATGRPEAVIGLHFFNLVPVMPLVEVVLLLHSSPRVRAFTARDPADVTRSPTEPGTAQPAGLVSPKPEPDPNPRP